MAEGITHHRFGPDDLNRLLKVDEGLFDNPIRPDEAKAFLADDLNELILAFEGDLAVGMVSATVLRHPDKPPTLFVNELGVRESHQRRGIATELMRKIIEIGREKGCDGGAWLGTEKDNVAALALYRKIADDEEKGSFFGWGSAL